MKQTLILIVLLLAALFARGQGTFLVDQSVNPTSAPGVFFNVQPGPTGESFVPSLSSVGFVQFYFEDPTFDGAGSTIDVDLWSGSLASGTLLGTSSSVSLAWNFEGSATFVFSTPISVAPGNTYHFQPVIQSGDSEQIGIVAGTDYPNGVQFLSGTAQSGGDLWFREGIVPEPSSVLLTVIGILGIYPILRNRRKLNDPFTALFGSKHTPMTPRVFDFCLHTFAATLSSTPLSLGVVQRK